MSEYANLMVREQLPEVVDPLADESTVHTVSPEFIIRDINLIDVSFKVLIGDSQEGQIRRRWLPGLPRRLSTRGMCRPSNNRFEPSWMDRVNSGPESGAGAGRTPG